MRGKEMYRLLATSCITTLLGSLMLAQTAGADTRFCSIGAKDLADKSAPKFDRYVSNDAPSKAPAKLDLRSSPIAKMYRTVIRQEMSQGANFAGFYRVAVWGCGSSCAQFAVVNLKTGSVITAQGVDNVSDVDFAADDFLPRANSGTVSFRFRKDSRLLVIVGAINEDDSKEGAYYYVLKGEKLRLIHKTIAARNKC
jgi:hypothetical protein